MDPNELIATIVWQAMVLRRQAEEVDRLQRELLTARQQQARQQPAQPATEEEERDE